MGQDNLRGELKQVAEGLIAEVTLHKRMTERIAGGDIGILIIRPQVYEQGDSLRIEDYRRGLLCQAKLKNSEGKWGKFTKRQVQVLPERIPYLSLLLYSYEDDMRRLLNPFGWRVCASANLKEIQQWLKDDDFPELVTSDHLIANLGYGNIGTDNDDIIDSIISPARNPILIIRITWPNHQRPGGPGSSVRIYSRQENRNQAAVKLRQS